MIDTTSLADIRKSSASAKKSYGCFGAMRIFAAVFLLLTLTACASVPATRLSVDPKTGVFTLDSPKDISITNLDVILTGGDHFKLEGYKSVNNPDVISAVANANAQMSAQITELLKVLSAAAASGAMKSVAP